MMRGQSVYVTALVYAVWGLIFGILISTLVDRAIGRELYPGQYAQVDPATREWFRSQRVPGGERVGQSCCSEADGTTAEEDIRGDHYWIRFQARGIDSGWMQVPDEVVIHEPNRHGAPVVWWFYNNGKPAIRCYAPGSGA